MHRHRISTLCIYNHPPCATMMHALHEPPRSTFVGHKQCALDEAIAACDNMDYLLLEPGCHTVLSFLTQGGHHTCIVLSGTTWDVEEVAHLCDRSPSVTMLAWSTPDYAAAKQRFRSGTFLGASLAIVEVTDPEGPLNWELFRPLYGPLARVFAGAGPDPDPAPAYPQGSSQRPNIADISLVLGMALSLGGHSVLDFLERFDRLEWHTDAGARLEAWCLHMKTTGLHAMQSEDPAALPNNLRALYNVGVTDVMISNVEITLQ